MVDGWIPRMNAIVVEAMTFNLDVLKNPWFNDFLFLVTISPDS